jgi:hypothetical protein
MANYAKQADDKELFNFTTRIRGCAIRRCGELLKEFDARGAPARIDTVQLKLPLKEF